MPEQWQNMVDITQFMWKHGDIPREIGWKTLVLIPKGKTDTRGIGLLKYLWKVVEAIIDTHLRASICLHVVLNGSHTGRGMGTETLELKMAQEISSMDQ